MLTAPIRNTARALIVRDGNILLLRKEGYADGERFALPGGGQAPGESLEEALVRECEEEIGIHVQIKDLVYVADLFKPRDAAATDVRHLVEFLFACEIPADYTPGSGHHPDRHQVEVLWTGLDALADLPLYPRALAAFLSRHYGRPAPTYLGTVDW